MRLALLLLVALLVPSWASAAVTDFGTCWSAGDVDCWEDDYLLQDSSLLPYHNVVLASPHIPVAMTYSQLEEGTRQAIWDKIAEACNESTGTCTNTGVLDETEPGNLAPDVDSLQEPWVMEIWLTKAEGNLAWGGRVAHALWLEVATKVPWSLTDYSDTDLGYLFDPDEVYQDGFAISTWNKYSSTQMMMLYQTVDYSAKDAYDIAISIVGGAPFTGTATQAVDLLVAQDGHGLIHAQTGDPKHGATLDHTFADGISRNGCGTASRFTMALARSLNIPAQTIWGWTEGTTHRSVFLPAIDAWTIHGDDIYTAGTKYPSAFAYYKNSHRTTYYIQGDDENGVYSGHVGAIIRQPYLLVLDAARYATKFCVYGWTAWESALTPYLFLPEDQYILDWLEAEMIIRTGCDGNPQ